MCKKLWYFLLPAWFAAATAAPAAVQHRVATTTARPQPYVGLGHTEPVSAIAWSPDGKILATSSSDGTVVLWDVAARRPRATLIGYTGLGASIRWSPDGKSLAGADQHTAIVWDAETGRRRARLTGFVGELSDLAWSRNGNTLIGFDNRRAVVRDPRTRWRWPVRRDNVLLWNARTGKLRARLKISAGLVPSGMGLSPDGRTLATFGYYPADEVILWDTGSWRRRVTLEGRRRDIGLLAWSPSSRILAGVGNDEIALWDADTGRRRASLPMDGDTYGFDSLAWSPDSTILAAASLVEPGQGGGFSRISFWDGATGRRRGQVQSDFDVADQLFWSPTGHSGRGERADRLSPLGCRAAEDPRSPEHASRLVLLSSVEPRWSNPRCYGR